MEKDTARGSSSSGEDAGLPAKLTANQLRELLQRLDMAEADPVQSKLEREEAAEKEARHEFWETQPVPQSGEVVRKDGPVHPPLAPEQIRGEPYPLPEEGYAWCVVDVESEAEINELHELLTENYVEDSDQMFRFSYSGDFLRWALMPPGFERDWHVGVRDSASGALIAFISGIPMETMVRDKAMPMAEINFLCLRKGLRGKHLTPLLIQEVTRRIHQKGIFQAVYTVGKLLLKAAATCQYFHRSLNPKKLMDTGFSQKLAGAQLARLVSVLRLPPMTATPGLRLMRRGDVGQVRKLLNRFLRTRYELLPAFRTDADVAHWLLPRDGVVWTYVVDDAEHAGRISDFFSFYSLPSTALQPAARDKGARRAGSGGGGGAAHTAVNAAYLFYYATKTDYAVELAAEEKQQCAGKNDEKALLKEKTNALIQHRLTPLIADALVLARDAGFDVVNCLDMMDNAMFIDALRFGRGDGHLRYYLYNYMARKIDSEKVGLVML
ncbi:glycylpeptide N-tetradecanoyltransferase [Coemansia helicoidea]|uniref:Glycylpeptide N-tetradecanoyltransferase n=1 Tax=Coemansia helicoidea TaxID=1286919 RepID=A0ACC1KRW8_9FUNG|nr:glycylpeptide N-tetradecanoyltransferase [Coemansia helicoidea]